MTAEAMEAGPGEGAAADADTSLSGRGRGPGEDRPLRIAAGQLSSDLGHRT